MTGASASQTGLLPTVEPVPVSPLRASIPSADTTDFVCAICQRPVCMRWNVGKADKIIPPICRGCEAQYSERVSRPRHGSFRDRREVMRGFALAEALYSEAMRKKWSKTYGIA